jgi:hypothetical protein
VCILYSGEVRGVGPWNCKRLAATDISVASSLRLPAPLQVNRLAGNLSGIQDISLCEGNARMSGVRGSQHAMVVSSVSGG